jgi:hypothetical protein
MNTGPNYENFKSPHDYGMFYFLPEHSSKVKKTLHSEMNTEPNYENFKSPRMNGIFYFLPEHSLKVKKNPAFRDEYRAQL